MLNSVAVAEVVALHTWVSFVMHQYYMYDTQMYDYDYFDLQLGQGVALLIYNISYR